MVSAKSEVIITCFNVISLPLLEYNVISKFCTQMFKEIQQDGYTRFGISEDEICPSCYNARLIKVRIYI